MALAFGGGARATGPLLELSPRKHSWGRCGVISWVRSGEVGVGPGGEALGRNRVPTGTTGSGGRADARVAGPEGACVGRCPPFTP